MEVWDNGDGLMRTDLYEILFGAFFLIINIINYLRDPSSYYIPFVFIFVTFIITGIFKFRKYYNKNLYLMIGAIILLLMWISGLIQTLSPDVDYILYYIETGLISLVIILVLNYSIKKWNKQKKALEYYDNVLAINPDDVVSMNNKGAELTRQTRYMDAMKCFEKALKIDSGNAAALHNKNVIEQKLKHRTLSDYLTDYPKLGITEKNGKLILEIKKE